MSHADDISAADEARRAQAILEPIFEKTVAELTRKMTEIAAETPWEAGKISKLAQGIKIARMQHTLFNQILANGKLAEQAQSHAAAVANLSDKKRWLGIG